MTGVLDELAGRSPRALLEELVRLAVGLARLDRPRPEVELFLASGQIVRGRVVSLDDTRDGAMLLLHVAGRDQAPTVAFVRMDHVAAVTVIDASVLVRPPVSDEPAPSRVELMRRVAAQHDALATRLGRAFALELAGELDDDGRRAVAGVLALVVDVVVAIGGDELGKAALDGLDAIELGAAARREVEKRGRLLAVAAPRLALDAFTAETLREAIERAL